MPVELKIKAEVLDVAEIRKAPDRMGRFVGSEMNRFANRFYRRMVKERMSGGTGIVMRGKNLTERVSGGRQGLVSKVTGRILNDLKFITKIRRWLVPHEYGAIIRGKPWLYIRNNKVRGGLRVAKPGQKIVKIGKRGDPLTSSKYLAKIVARVRSVFIRPRLGWRAMYQRMEPDLIRRVIDAANRAVKVSTEKKVKVGNG